MTWKQMQEVVANCEGFCKVYNRVPYFYITGGDPILHPDFWKLMVLLKSKDIPFTLMGNPFHLNDQICRMLKPAAVRNTRCRWTVCVKPMTGSASPAAST